MKPVDRLPIVAGQREVNAGERGDGAAGPEQGDVGRALRQHVGEAGEAAHRALAHAVVSGDAVGALERLAAFAFGQRHHPPRRRPPGADARVFLAMFDQHELGRAAADVEDQRRPAAGLEQFVAAEHRQPGFLLRRDDVERDPGFAAHPLDELAAVDRAATGLGGDRAGDADVAADQFVGADR